jgi:hypothetical protein
LRAERRFVRARNYTNVTAPAPAITSVSPDTGSTAGGQAVLISGSNFSGATAVTFGGTEATSFSILDDSEISAVAPAGSAGNVDVQVTTNNGTSSTGSSDTFTYLTAAAPAVTGLGTSSGSSNGGTSVTISGSGFTGATQVWFGSVAATSFTVNNDGSIFAWAPAEASGTVNITVTTPSGTSTTGSANQYTYAASPSVTSVTPNSGSTAGGTSVTIMGSGFTGATAVYFGSVAATSFTVNGNSSITAVAPAEAAGTVNVTITTAYGTSAIVSADQFTYYETPVVTGISPSSGPASGGTEVTISGSGFTGATQVWFGAMAATSFTVNSDGSITAYSPAQTAGTVDIRVLTPHGLSPTGSADEFTYS